MFEFEKINLNNIYQIKCLKDLWYDSSVKKYFNTFSMQLSFESFLVEMSNPYASLNDRLIKYDSHYIGWLNCGIYNEEGKKGAVLSYALIKEFRGIGLGKKSLSHYIDSLGVDEILVEVHFSNAEGQALVNSLGFEQYGVNEEDGLTKYKLNIQKGIAKQKL